MERSSSVGPDSPPSWLSDACPTSTPAIVAWGSIRVFAGQGVSEAVFTMMAMDAVINLADWRRRRDASDPPQSEAVDEHVDLARLERAVERVHELVGVATDGG